VPPLRVTPAVSRALLHRKENEMSFTVVLKHKFGTVQIENVTEIHYCYPSLMGKRIVFESDIEGTGCTYPVEDVIEFEARLTPPADLRQRARSRGASESNQVSGASR